MSAKAPTEVDKEIGRCLRDTRLSRGMSQEALAAGAGITFQQVQKYENGANRISVGRLVRLAALLGVDPAALLPVPGAPMPPPLSREAARVLALMAEMEPGQRRSIVQVADAIAAARMPAGAEAWP